MTATRSQHLDHRADVVDALRSHAVRARALRRADIAGLPVGHVGRDSLIDVGSSLVLAQNVTGRLSLARALNDARNVAETLSRPTVAIVPLQGNSIEDSAVVTTLRTLAELLNDVVPRPVGENQ